jgi:hypothetical protein
MPEFLRLTGMPQAIPTSNTKDIRFVLSVLDGEPIICAAGYGVAAQISSGLGTALRSLRVALAGQNAWEQVATEQIREAHVQKDQLPGQVLVQLTSVLGVPYLFQFPPQAALQIAEWLKTEAAKESPMGTA